MKAAKRAVSLVAALILVMSLVACGEKGLKGTWVDSSTGVDNVFEFNDDGKGKMSVTGMLELEFTYKYTDDKITVTIMGADVEYGYRLDGDTLVLITEEGEEETFKRK